MVRIQLAVTVTGVHAAHGNSGDVQRATAANELRVHNVEHGWLGRQGLANGGSWEQKRERATAARTAGSHVHLTVTKHVAASQVDAHAHERLALRLVDGDG